MEEANGNGVAGIGVQIRAVGVCQSVAVRGQSKRKEILRDIDASFPPGTFTACMGASGAGKSTLLNVLRAGRSTGGAVLANGAPYTKLARRLIVTVPQDDILLPGLTALELLTYQAQLRLPRSVGAGRQARARAVLSQLHFSPEDMVTKIGSVDDRGLSGGQRKRVSIALELLTNPAVLLVDEPTSGLDAKMALDVVGILKDLAREGRTLIVTVHQPSFRIYSQFDRLLLLSGGRVTFAGRLEQAEAYFSGMGFVTPEHENPAEYFISLEREAARGVDLPAAWATSSKDAAEEGAPGTDERPPTIADAAGSFQGRLIPLDGDAAYAVPGIVQAWVLFRRRLYDSAKDFAKLGRTLFCRSLSRGQRMLRTQIAGRPHMPRVPVPLPPGNRCAPCSALRRGAPRGHHLLPERQQEHLQEHLHNHRRPVPCCEQLRHGHALRDGAPCATVTRSPHQGVHEPCILP